MTDAQHTFADSRPDAFRIGAERLPLTQAAALIVTASVALWCVIGLGVNWIVS